MINQLTKSNLKKQQKKHILGFSNKTALFWTLLYSYNSDLKWSLAGDAPAATVVGVVMLVLAAKKKDFVFAATERENRIAFIAWVERKRQLLRLQLP